MNNTIFPISFGAHAVFCLIAVVFFLLQFYRQHYKFQMIMVFTIPATMLIYLSDSRTWFYAVGLVVSIAFVTAIILSIIEHKKADKAADALALSKTYTNDEEAQATSSQEWSDSASSAPAEAAPQNEDLDLSELEETETTAAECEDFTEVDTENPEETV